MLYVLAVVNPKAGAKSKKNLEDLINSSFNEFAEVDFLYWQSVNENITENVKKQLNNKSYDIVMACGGDGTVNCVAQALLNRKEKLAILPLGSGNGLALHLKIPLNIEKALNVAKNGKEIEIDAVQINSNYFFCTAGVGYDAHVAHLFANESKRGFFTYLKIVLKSFFTYKPKQYIIQCDNAEYKTDAFFITIANANQWGNNVKVAPLANISDNLLNIVVLKPFLIYHLPLLAIRLLSNSFHLSKKVLNYTAKTVVIKTDDKEIKGHYDGEPVIFPSEIVCQNENKALKVIVP